ncbi:MAG: DUF5675 family protein [Marinomonas gallaica]
MINLTVVRSYLSDATVGFLVLPSGQRLQTLEQAWRNNRQNVSCIPQGTYVVRRDRSGRWQFYSIQNVPNRTLIEIHPANYVSQLEGCLSLGMGRMNDNVSLSRSKDAIDMLLDEVGDEDFILTFRAFDPAFDEA